ncbi:MAG: FecCD family ABC transporter permease [Bacillota bacterium]|jgi:iron complex transport system permease protein
MAKRRKRWRCLALCLGLASLLLIMVVSMTLGPADISFPEALELTLGKIPFLRGLVDPDKYPAAHQSIVYRVRMPRVLLASLVGGALAAVGAALQGLFKNPMADPFVIGVSSGAALGATAAIVTGFSAVLGLWALPLAAFCGALLATGVVYQVARVGNKLPVHNLLLAGIALSSFMSALMSFILLFNNRELHQVVYWMLGSFSGKDWSHLQVAAVIILTGIAVLWVFAKDLNAMLFGEETARHLGIDTERAKKLLLVVSSFTVAAAVAVSGTIGFVGLIVPHIMRLIVGPDHRILLPAAAMAGGAFLVAADTFARIALAPAEIPVGIITAFFGGPFFIYLLRRKKRGVF